MKNKRLTVISTVKSVSLNSIIKERMTIEEFIAELNRTTPTVADLDRFYKGNYSKMAHLTKKIYSSISDNYCGHDNGSDYLVIWNLEREETDEEYSKRQESLRLDKENNKKRKKIIEEKEKELYLKLSKKYGKELL